MKKIFGLLLINWLFLPHRANAGNSEPDPPAPIDGGASLLVGAGVAYGMKKIRDKKKSRKDLKDTI